MVQKTAVVIWRPKISGDMEEHQWCTYCRRPTVFKWFTSHHAYRNSPLRGLIDPADLRCTICGAREEFIRSSKGARPGYSVIAPAGKRRRR